MTDRYLIASYGGSGSTYLTKKLSQVKKGIKFVHTHAFPTNLSVGVPVFNYFTGHWEGPFSRTIKLPEKTKIVVISRNPAEAYLSRCSFKHYSHLWYGTPKFTNEIGKVIEGEHVDEKKHRATFFDLWRKNKNDNIDILATKTYMYAWKEFAKKSNYDILFCEYENLCSYEDEIAKFIGVDKISFNDFNPRSREVPDEVSSLFKNENIDRNHIFSSDIDIKSNNPITVLCKTEEHSNIIKKLNKIYKQDKFINIEQHEDSTFCEINLDYFIYLALFSPNELNKNNVCYILCDKGTHSEIALKSLEYIWDWIND